MQSATQQSLNGIDISIYNGEVNFVGVRKGKAFVIMRAASKSTGNFHVDGNFYQNAAGARAQRIPAGAYYFPDIIGGDMAGAREQAHLFIDTLENGFGPGDYGDIFPALDIEGMPYPQNPAVLSTDQLLEWVEAFRDEFERSTGRALMLYFPIYLILGYDNAKHSTRGFILNNSPLWTSDLSDDPYSDSPPDAGGWSEWRVWQYSFTGFVDGITVHYTGDDLGTGDGSQTVYYLSGAPLIPDSVVIYFDGTVVAAAEYSVNMNTGAVTFTSPPAGGVVITGDFSAEAVDLDVGPDELAYLMPPSNVTGLTAIPEAGSVTLSWTANPEPDIAGYYVYFRDFDTPFRTVAGREQITISGLQNGVTYQFGVAAFDADGDVSPVITRTTVTPNENLLKLTWISPDGEEIDFGAEVGPYVIREFTGEGSTQAVEQTQTAPFQEGVSLFNVDVKARTLALSLRIVGENRLDMFLLRKKLTAAFAFEPNPDIHPLDLYETGYIKYYQQTVMGENPLVLEAIPRESPQFEAIEGINYACDADIEFFCPYPFWKDTDKQVIFLADSTGGMEFPIAFPLEIMAQSNRATIMNEGEVKAPPVITIIGECDGFTITNETVGKSLIYGGHIPENNRVEIYTEFGKKRVIFVDEFGTRTNIIANLKFTDSEFWYLKPGENEVVFRPVQSSNSRAKIEFQRRFAGV